MKASSNTNQRNRTWLHYIFIGVLAPVFLSFIIPYLRTRHAMNGPEDSLNLYDNWDIVLSDGIFLVLLTGILFLLILFILKHLMLESILISLLIGLLITGTAYVLFLQRELLQISAMYEGNGIIYGLVFLFYGWLLIYRTIRLSKWNLGTRTVAIVGLLMAMNIVLGRIGITTPVVRITFSFLPNALIGMLFGPWIGGTAAALSDILSFIIGGGVGGFFPGFTLSAFLGGAAYGVLLHKKTVTKKRVVAVVAFNTLFVNLVLNTIWIYILTQNPLVVIIPPRLLQNAVMAVVRFISIWFITTNKQLRRVYMKYSTAKS